MKKIIIFIVTMFVFTASFGVAHAADQEKESTYDRVMRTKTIRCGYALYEPFVSKDVVTGEMSGLTYEYINQVAKNAGIQIKWTEEMNVDQVIPSLNYGRIDAFCIPCTPDRNWEKQIGFSAPLGALPYFTFVPEDSTLTAEQLEKAKFATVDGYALTEITHDAYSEADYYSLQQMTSTAEMYDQLRYHKAEAHVNEAISAANYMKNNPGTIRRFSDKPVVAMRMFLITPGGDDKMDAFMNETFDAGLPENLALAQNLREKYDVPDDALLLGDQCTQPAVTEKGWKICAPTEEGGEEEAP